MRLSIKASLGFLILITCIGFVILSGLALFDLKNNLLDDRKIKTKNLVDSYISSIEYFDNQAKSGLITKEEAQKQFFNMVNTVKYDTDNYFFGFNSKHTYVL